MESNLPQYIKFDDERVYKIEYWTDYAPPLSPFPLRCPVVIINNEKKIALSYTLLPADFRP